MNKNTAKDYLPLVQALAEGKVIQVSGVNGWVDVEAELSLCFAADQYRIKPEPREIWVNHYPEYAAVGYESKQAAEDNLNPFLKGVTRRYREVIE